MIRALWPSTLRVSVLAALSASAALTVDYLSRNPAFCGGTSGCGVVRRSGWGYVAGTIPLPALGLLAFAGVLSLSLGPSGVRRLAPWAAMLGALIAGALIVVQWLVVKAFCSLCLVTDVAAIVAGIAGALIAFQKPASGEPSTIDEGPLRAWAWAAFGAVAVAAPVLWPVLRPAAAVPSGVREQFVAGKINVVEFVDFQCPFCRMFHPTLKGVVREYGARVHFVRLDLPLESHSHARGAARAHVCGQELGQGDKLADALFEAEDLTKPGLIETARKVGLETQRFERCLAAKETEAKVVASERILKDSEMLQGLPTTFVGDRMLVGALDEVALRDAFEHAATGGSERGVPGSVYLAVVAAVAGVLVWQGRKGSAPPS